MKILKYLLALVLLLVFVKMAALFLFMDSELFFADDNNIDGFKTVNELRELGVNVFYMEMESNGARKIVVYYEPDFKGGDNQLAMDYGIIAGYLFATENFDAIVIKNYFEENEVFSVYITYESIYNYLNHKISIEEFKNSWEVYS
ncbi:hypothetical protein [Archaeoglobus neptunius]|uniref:hypothetical protein n=1 Tax=Archaeoglobus neptunius TaxID=2798580 RepID=UPI0019273184|nr:hypothetical protein [Archaeoglobus neptunius]